jgi:CBS domain containing-hemolysin-like protein
MSEFQSAIWVFLAVGLTLLVVGFVEWRNKARGRRGSLIWALVWSMSLASVSVATLLSAGANVWMRVAVPLVVILLALGMGLKWTYRRRLTQTDSSPLEQADQVLLERILSLRSTRVEDIMTPMDRMTYAVAASTVPDVLALAKRTGHSRIPLLDSPGERPLGFIHAKDLAPFIHQESPKGRVADLRRQVLTVSPLEAASRLLDSFTQRRIHIAIVTDSEGKALGLVSLGDFYEHLLGSRTGTAG